ncbi:unnamed protein product [Arctia plantaginis]|uniref:Uncharacterized protein n=1 Tax=Arctia plantaginis TaxID=874455 RepID=A0A8S1B1S6_ARCPL|nr:unnamed protein product [Arctia plantaginis]
MRVRCQRKEMADFNYLLNHKREEKLELVKILLESIKADKCKQNVKRRDHHHHGMSGFGRLWKHGHRGLGHCHSFKHKHHGHHHGFLRRGEHPHGGHGRHHPRCHDQQYHPEEIKAMWLIDLTEDDQNNGNDCVTEPSNQTSASTSNEQNDESVTNINCKFTRFARRHCGRRGRWMNNLYKRSNNESNSKDNATQTDEPMDGENEAERKNLLTSSFLPGTFFRYLRSPR